MIGSYYSYELIFLLEARTKRRGGLKRAFGIIVDFYYEKHVHFLIHGSTAVCATGWCLWRPAFLLRTDALGGLGGEGGGYQTLFVTEGVNGKHAWV